MIKLGSLKPYLAWLISSLIFLFLANGYIADSTGEPKGQELIYNAMIKNGEFERAQDFIINAKLELIYRKIGSLLFILISFIAVAISTKKNNKILKTFAPHLHWGLAALFFTGFIIYNSLTDIK